MIWGIFLTGTFLLLGRERDLPLQPPEAEFPAGGGPTLGDERHTELGVSQGDPEGDPPGVVRHVQPCGRTSKMKVQRTPAAAGPGAGADTVPPGGARPAQASSEAPKPGIDLAAQVRTGPASTSSTRMLRGSSSLARWCEGDSRATLATPKVGAC